MTAGSEGFIRCAVTKVYQNGKQLLETLIERGVPIRAGPKVRGFGGERTHFEVVKARKDPVLPWTQKQSLFGSYLRQSYAQSFVAKVGREAGKRMWTRTINTGGPGRVRYLSQRLAMFGFVGVSMLNNPDKELDPLPICKHLAEMFSMEEDPEFKPVGQKVDDYSFGRLIATGCDAAVYEVNEVRKTSVPVQIPPMVRSASVESLDEEYELVHEESFELVDLMESPVESDVEEMPCDGEMEQPVSLPTESVCIKVMFNYGISSNSSSIVRAMRRELVPALTADDVDDPLCGAHVKKKNKRLPPHPNIIPIYGWFVDETPLLANALDMYPIALPLRLCEDGCGRNSTLFIVMKRYESTLAEHLHACGTPDVRDGVLLLLQLLHGIQHLQHNNVAHRDLKSDNLLLEWTEGRPRLVLSDFGHCLTGQLVMPYPNDCMDKGGNGKLMAPEIALAEPGPGSYLDFRSSDLWAAGTIAYEIFSGVNPFYSSAFDGRFYQEEDLPPMPTTVPVCVERVVKGLLRRDQMQRLPSEIASNILSLWLWAPAEWRTSKPSALSVVRWLVQLSAAVVLGVPERQQMALFLGRLQWRTLWQALELMADEK